MAPKPPDRKRKRGRPPGASKPAEDASSREQPETNEPDVDNESRPKKRGRNATKDQAAPSTSREQQDEPVQTGRRGRPRKDKAQTTQPELEIKGKPQRKAAEHPTKKTATDSESRLDVDSSSSERRRSGRGRRVFNSDELYAARQPNPSPTQFTSPPSDSSRMPPPPRRSKKAEPELPSSMPRRSDRERRAWDPENAFNGSRQDGSQEQEPTPAIQKIKRGKKADAPQEPQAAAKSRKTKPSAQNTTTVRGYLPEDEVVALKTRDNNSTTRGSMAENRRPARAAPQQDSPGEGPSQPMKKKKDAKAAKNHGASPADTTQPKRRGRKVVNDGATQGRNADEPSKPRGSRGRPPKAIAGAEEVQEPVPAKIKSRSTQRQEPAAEIEGGSDSDSDAEEEEEEEMPFRYLRETTRNVPRSTIINKWTPLNHPAVSAVSALLSDVQRPVLLRLQNTSQQRGNASDALGRVTRRIQSRLLKGFPFPSPTISTSKANANSCEEDFNFERAVDARRTLENTLNPLLHSARLLEREVSKEEAALTRDYERLHTLEANAKSAAHEWRDKAKREHTLAPGIKKKGELETKSRNRLELVPMAEAENMGGLFMDLDDPELVTLSQQIGSHMKSMKENLRQIDGVVPAITQSKAALQQVLLRHVDDEQYEKVLLG